MTMVWLGLTILGGLGLFAAFVQVVVIAFHENTSWGLACLTGLGSVPFMFRYWERVKIAVFVMLGGFLVLVFGAIGYSMTTVNAGIEEYEDLGERVAWEAPRTGPGDFGSVDQGFEPVGDSNQEWTDSVDSVGATPVPESTVEEEPRATGSPGDAPVIGEPDDVVETPVPRRHHRDGRLVEISELAGLKGERVVIILKNLERVPAYVVGVTDHSVQLRHRVGGGSVVYTIDFDDIREIRSRKAP